MGSSFGGSIKLSGESEYRKALKECDSSLRVLGSELKEITSQFDKNDRSVENLSKQNEVLTKKITEQESKVEILRKALKASAEETGENSEKTKRYQIQLNNAQAQLNTMNRQLENNKRDMEAAEKATNDEKKAVKEMGDEADKSSGKLQGLGNALKATVAAAAAVGAAAVAVGKQIWNMAEGTAEAGDEIDKQSQKAGLSAESYQKWDYAMQLAGTSMSSCITGLKTLTNTFDDAINGSDGAATKFHRLGLSIGDLKDKSREEIFAETVKALQNVSDETERAALANDMFGKSGQDLLPLLNQSSEETQALLEQAEKYGMVMSDEAVAASAAFEDSLTKLQGTVKGTKNSLTGELLPGMTSVIDGITELITGNKAGSELIKSGITDVIDSVTEMIPQIVDLLSVVSEAVIENAPAVIESLASSIIDMLPDFLELALTDVLPNLIITIVNITKNLVSSLSAALPDIMSALAEGIVTVTNALFSPESITSTIEIIIGFIENTIKGLTKALPILIEGVFTLVQGLIKALPDIISYLLEEIPTIYRMLNDTLLASLPILIDGTVQLIDGLVKAMPDIILALVEATPDIISAIVDGIIDSLPLLIEGSVKLVFGLVKALPDITFELFKALPRLMNSLLITIQDSLFGIFDVGVNLVRGLWEGINNSAAWLWDQISGWLNDLWNGMLNFFGIRSPSTRMRDIVGKNIVKGLAAGIEEEGDSAIKVTEDLAKNIAGIDFAVAAIDTSQLARQLEVMLPDYSGKSAVSASLGGSYAPIGVAGAGATSVPVSVVVQFGDVHMASDMDVYDVADQVSSIIASEVVKVGRRFG